MEFTKDLKNKKIFIKREFKAPVDEVWRAYTESEILDQWWAPKPWKAKTHSMDFREGGTWLYSMLGPEGEEHFARSDYKNIIPHKSFSVQDSFTDGNGNINTELPSMHWDCVFEESGNRTINSIVISFKSEEDLNKILEMGFKEGFADALNNLDEIFEKQYH